jgi:hypothetical protein
VRQTTKRKYYARSNVAASVRCAVNEIGESVKLVADLPAQSPLSISLTKVVKHLQDAIEWDKTYGLGRKRIKSSLEAELKTLQELLQEVMSVPVTKDEKIISRSSHKPEPAPSPVPATLTIPIKEPIAASKKPVPKCVSHPPKASNKPTVSKPNVNKVSKSEVKKNDALSKIKTRKIQPDRRAAGPGLRPAKSGKKK